jgi:hypothetical protein
MFTNGCSMARRKSGRDLPTWLFEASVYGRNDDISSYVCLHQYQGCRRRELYFCTAGGGTSRAVGVELSDSGDLLF